MDVWFFFSDTYHHIFRLYILILFLKKEKVLFFNEVNVLKMVAAMAIY